MNDRHGFPICSAPIGEGITRSFKYQESTRQRVEREAMERLTRIYNNRKEVNEALLNFPSISDQDVYGQTPKDESIIYRKQTI